MAVIIAVAATLFTGMSPATASSRGRDHAAMKPAKVAQATVDLTQRITENAVLRTSYAMALIDARVRAVARWRAMVAFATAIDAARREQAARDAVWDRMAACETGGNWSMQGSSYSGGVGFANSTWSAYGGQEFASNAGMATREQQIVIANRVRGSVGYGAWGCAPAAGVG